jgi:hypothetical protein
MIESEPATQTPTPLMSTVKLFCPHKHLADVMAYMMKSNVKYWPVERYWHKLDVNKIGYRLEMEKDHSIVPFLILKYDLQTID